MPRIRTIKPEFPQSESMGAVSREARYLFVLLWTLCDDEGRTRAASRMLASLLFPYDDDAPSLIDGWLAELEGQSCVVRYAIEGATYLQVCNWLKHQKIDKPSKSKIPAFDESSRILANPREPSALDQGPRIKDQGRDQGPVEAPQPKEPRSRGTRLPTDWQPSPADLDFIASKRPELDPVATAEGFRDFWHAKTGSDATKADWAATWRNWVRNQRANPQTRAGPPQSLQAQVKAANRAAIERMINGGSDVVSGGNRPRLGQFLGDRAGEPAGVRLAGPDNPNVD